MVRNGLITPRNKTLKNTAKVKAKAKYSKSKKTVRKFFFNLPPPGPGVATPATPPSRHD